METIRLCIVTGPNIYIATKLIRRLKNIFERRLDIYFDNKETGRELSGCRIEGVPFKPFRRLPFIVNPFQQTLCKSGEHIVT